MNKHYLSLMSNKSPRFVIGFSLQWHTIHLTIKHINVSLLTKFRAYRHVIQCDLPQLRFLFFGHQFGSFAGASFADQQEQAQEEQAIKITLHDNSNKPYHRCPDCFLHIWTTSLVITPTNLHSRKNKGNERKLALRDEGH